LEIYSASYRGAGGHLQHGKSVGTGYHEPIAPEKGRARRLLAQVQAGQANAGFFEIAFLLVCGGAALSPKLHDPGFLDRKK
jgi:hypothetical protein